MRVAPAGDHAVLVELDPSVAAEQLHSAAFRLRSRDDVLACIVGHSSLYVVFANRVPDTLSDLVNDAAPGASPVATTHTIRVSFRDEYTPDLTEFLTRQKLTRDEFLQRLPSVRLLVRYLGFRGGYAYLDGWPPEWAMPRRTTSRPVARGSLAIAGGVAGFYPIDTPGGWNVLGRTGEPIANRFVPGDAIVIEPTLELLPAIAKDSVRAGDMPGIVAPFVTRVRAPDWSNLERGLPVGGPFDLEAARAANVAAGKAADAELFEFAQSGPQVTPDEAVILGWCDARRVRVERVRRDETYDFGRIRDGLRAYLAIGDRPGHLTKLDRDDRLVIRTVRGPHDIGVNAIECVVTPKLDRVGVRMTPVNDDVRRYDAPADLPSLGMQFGTLQLHPNGDLVAMGPDHPVTGGYLQPMTVIWADRWKLAHLAPGERVRFIAQ